MPRFFPSYITPFLTSCTQERFAVRVITAIRSPSNRVEWPFMRHLRLSYRNTVLGFRLSPGVSLYNLRALKIGTLKKNNAEEMLSSPTVKFFNNTVSLEMRNAAIKLTFQHWKTTQNYQTQYFIRINNTYRIYCLSTYRQCSTVNRKHYNRICSHI
jgi:hypothetical protein